MIKLYWLPSVPFEKEDLNLFVYKSCRLACCWECLALNPRYEFLLSKYVQPFNKRSVDVKHCCNSDHQKLLSNRFIGVLDRFQSLFGIQVDQSLFPHPHLSLWNTRACEIFDKNQTKCFQTLAILLYSIYIGTRVLTLNYLPPMSLGVTIALITL